MKFPYSFVLSQELREREGVERRELSSLFVTYAQRMARRRGGLAWRGYSSLLPPPPVAWRRLAARFLRMLSDEGRSCLGTEHLRALLAMPKVAGASEFHQGLDPVELIVTAIRIWPSPEGYLALGQMLLMRERVDEAREVYVHLMQTMDRDEEDEWGWRVREGLGLTWEAEGRSRVALGCLEKSAERAGAGVGPLVAAWSLAMELGQRDRAERLAERLNGRLRADSLRLAHCADWVVARRALAGLEAWLPPRECAPFARQALSSATSTGRLCQMLLERRVS